VGYLDLSHVSFRLPDGRMLLDDVTFRVGEGAKAALVGANGVGKTTLLRIAAGDVVPAAGSVARSGGLGVMRQFVGSVRDDSTVRDLLLSVAPPALRGAAAALDRAELQMMECDDEPTQLRYAHALTEWGDAGGYDAEVLWDVCTTEALGTAVASAQWREVRTLSAHRPDRPLRPRRVLRRAGCGARRERLRQVALPPAARRRRRRARRCRPARRPGRARSLHPDPRASGTGGPHPRRHPLARGARPRSGDGGAAPVRAHEQADQPFETLSGGQQARLQILLLEIAGATMLLLHEPTDNLDLASAEALEEGLGTREHGARRHA
jgi:energy-coupling factor transporter ATP-binding protein EcfA2